MNDQPSSLFTAYYLKLNLTCCKMLPCTTCLMDLRHVPEGEISSEILRCLCVCACVFGQDLILSDIKGNTNDNNVVRSP